MNIAIMITAHKNEAQTKRLINHLKTSFDVYIHIDKKSKMNIESYDNVFVYKTINVVHSGLSQVTSSLILFKEAYKHGYDRYIFISGQDVPIKSNKYINDFFSKPENIDKEFILCEYIHENHSHYEDICYRLKVHNFGLHYRKILHKNIRILISKLPFLKREMPNWNIYFGSNWFNLTHEGLGYFLSYLDNNKEYFSRFKYSLLADELIINTVLMNSHLSEKCISDNLLRYIVWYRGAPHILLLKDYELLKSSNALFARKFDSEIDSEIIDKLYEDITSG